MPKLAGFSKLIGDKIRKKRMEDLKKRQEELDKKDEESRKEKSLVFTKEKGERMVEKANIASEILKRKKKKKNNDY